MPGRELKWLDAAADAAETAQLGEFKDTLRHSPRYTLVSIFAIIAGCGLSALSIWGIFIGGGVEAVLFLIVFALVALAGFFSIGTSIRDASERVYLFDDGFVYINQKGQDRAYAGLRS